MDELVAESANRFEELRRNRIHIAQDFVAGCQTDEELVADVSNILMLYAVAKSIANMPQGFVSNG